MIECSAAAQAAQFRSIEDLDALKLSLYEMHNSKDAQVHANADMNFHLRIVTASQNPVTQLVYGSIKNLVFGLMTRSATDNTVTKEGLPLHDDVYQAIADKDAVLAEKVMRKIILVCQEHYGDDFSCAGYIWTERTAMRLCTGYWYNNYNIEAVVESLESTQPLDQRYCVTRWELDRWKEGTRIGRRNSVRQRNAVLSNFVINHANTHWGSADCAET
jgi:hypothetical protein